MDIPRRVILGLLVHVASVAAVYAAFFNGEFSRGGSLPTRLVLTSMVAAVVLFGIMLWWLNRVDSGQVPDRNVRDYDGFYAMLAVAGIVSELLTIAVEAIAGAPALLMAVPISILTYCLGVMWMHRRYHRRRPAKAAPTG